MSFNKIFIHGSVTVLMITITMCTCNKLAGLLYKQAVTHPQK